MNWNDYGYHPMHSSGYWFFAMILMFLFFGIVVWSIIRIVDRSLHSRQQEPKSALLPTALEVLDLRLAKGEISLEDYVVAKSHLKQ
jgi:uncharacterized membrane protein